MYNLAEIAKITDGKLTGNGKATIEYLIFDSRMHISSVNSLFFAIKTNGGDGHKYINDLKNKGIKNFVVENGFKINKNLQDCNFIFVKNSVNALQKLVATHRQGFDIPVAGITGSNGKTIVKEWLADILNGFFPTLQSPKSYNSQIGVPLSVWLLNDNYKFAIFEAGISRPSEMEKIEKIIRPTIGIFTNIGDAHQENFSSIQEKIKEKIKLFKNSKKIIYSTDYQDIDTIIQSTYPEKEKFTFSFKKNANLQVLNREPVNGNCLIDVKYQNKIYTLKLNFKEFPLIEDAITVLASLLVIFPDKTPADFDLSRLRPIEMRLQQIQAINKCTIINDSYSNDLVSLGMALDVLNAQNQHNTKTVILSDIFQAGDDEKILYKKVASLINGNNVKKLIGVGEKLNKFSYLFNIEKYFFKTTNDLIHNLNKLQFFDEAILIKGARKFHFEEIVKRLEQKSHRTILEINMSALQHNLKYFRNLLKPTTKIMVMVKAFSYGSGSFEIANFLQRQNIDYLAVAIADEGIDLRKAGIKIPILILNPDAANFDLFVDYRIEPEIYSFRMLNEFYNAVKNKVLNPYPIHLKINTGMNRVGFDAKDIDKLAEELKKMPKIFVKSVFSHLVGADNKKFDDFTSRQISDFQNITSKLEKKLSYSFLRHILNSAGIERFTEYQFDMVRLGIGLYGISSNNANLRNISTLKTRIIQIRNIAKGESVGYSRAWIATRNTQVATIPVGYADGLNRLLSNGIGEVIVNNKRAKIIGNICMDITMIDITDIDANEGDEVIIFDNNLTINELAKKLNTIPYEILTGISQRVKRIYIWE